MLSTLTTTYRRFHHHRFDLLLALLCEIRKQRAHHNLSGSQCALARRRHIENAGRGRNRGARVTAPRQPLLSR